MAAISGYRFGPFWLESATGRLTRAGAEVSLTPTMSELLLHLVSRSPQTVTKDELLDAVWRNRVVEEANVKQTVFTLRRALGEEGGALIATVPGRGYRFTAAVGLEACGADGDVAAPGLPAGTPARVGASPKRAPWRSRPLMWGAAALATATVGAAVLLQPSAFASRGHASIVLADVSNLTHDPVFNRTLTSLVRADLSQSPVLSVLPERRAEDTLDEMGRPKSAPVTPAVAQELCARTNSDEVLDGAIAPIGSQYLITLRATDCTGRQAIAEETAQASRREDVVGRLDGLITRMRRRLGEPVLSVDRFNVPLMPARSASLEAVKAYSEGVWLNNHGKPDAAVAPLERAVEIDPQFAAAYFSLAGIYNNLLQPARADAAVVRAYALRDRLNERQRVNLEVYYGKIHTGDYSAMLRALQGGVAAYPAEWTFWANLANAQLDLGDQEAAAASAERAVALNPPSELPYLALALAELERGRVAASRRASDLALKAGLGGGMIHAALLDADLVDGDAKGVRDQLAWAATQPDDGVFLTIEGRMAYREGRIAQGDAAFDRVAALSGAKPQADPNLGFRARLLDGMGLRTRARALLSQAQGLDGDQDFILALAQAGDPDRAQRLLDRQVALSPENTLVRIDFAPKARCLLALRRGDPKAALQALAPAQPYPTLGFDVPYLTGQAYLAEKDGARAETAFRSIVDNPGRYPESPYYALAEFGLARSLAVEGKRAPARAALQRFLAAWREADPSIPILRTARAEADRLARG